MIKKIDIKKMTMSAMFAALLCAGAFIQIPTPPVPVSLQTMFAIMAGLMLGPQYGAASAVTYMVLGLAGIPVFTGGGGINYVFRPSFGFIVGFAAGAFIAGLIIERAEKLSMKNILFASFMGLAAVYIIGCAYMYFILNVYMNKDELKGIGYVLMNGLLLFLPGETAKMTLGAVLVRRLKPVVIKA